MPLLPRGCGPISGAAGGGRARCGWRPGLVVGRLVHEYSVRVLRSTVHRHEAQSLPKSRRPAQCGERGGQGRVRTGDLSLFRRTLLPTELPGQCWDYQHKSGDEDITASATPTGLEPATSAVTGRRANQLRYGALKALGLCCFIEAACRTLPDQGLARQIASSTLGRAPGQVEVVDSSQPAALDDAPRACALTGGRRHRGDATAPRQCQRAPPQLRGRRANSHHTPCRRRRRCRGRGTSRIRPLRHRRP